MSATTINYLTNAWFVCVSAPSVVGFGLLLATVLYHPALRGDRSFVLIACSATANLVETMTALALGIERLTLMLLGRTSEPVNKWYCVMRPPHLPAEVFFPVSLWMLIALSLDRVFLFTYPLWYHTRRASYALKLSAPGLAFGIFKLTALIVYMWPDRDSRAADQMTTRYCLFNDIMPEPFFTIFLLQLFILKICLLFSAPTCTTISALLSLVAYRKQKQRQSKIRDTSRRTMNEADRPHSRAITKLFSATILINCAFFMLPFAAVLVTKLANCNTPFCLHLAPFMYNIMLSHYVVQVATFFKVSLIRQGVRAMLKRKRMPANVNVWK